MWDATDTGQGGSFKVKNTSSAAMQMFVDVRSGALTISQASGTVLGQGWASAGFDPSTVPGGQRGVGYLLAEGERPVRVKGFYLDDDEVAEIAERAAARRVDGWLAATSGDHAEHGTASRD